MDRIPNCAIFLHELINNEQKFPRTLALGPSILRVRRVIRHAHDEIHPKTLGKVECPPRLGFGLHIDRPNRIRLNARRRTFLLENGNIRIGRTERQMEIFDTEIMKVRLLHNIQRLINVVLTHREAREPPPRALLLFRVFRTHREASPQQKCRAEHTTNLFQSFHCYSLLIVNRLS